MAAPVVCDHAEALAQEEHQLRVPIVGRERPAVMEDDRLGVARPPVLVEDFGTVAGGDEGMAPVLRGSGLARSAAGTFDFARGIVARLSPAATAPFPYASVMKGMTNWPVRARGRADPK